MEGDRALICLRDTHGKLGLYEANVSIRLQEVLVSGKTSARHLVESSPTLRRVYTRHRDLWEEFAIE